MYIQTIIASLVLMLTTFTWKSYVHPQGLFSFKYPPGWVLTSSSDSQNMSVSNCVTCSDKQKTAYQKFSIDIFEYKEEFSDNYVNTTLKDFVLRNQKIQEERDQGLKPLVVPGWQWKFLREEKALFPGKEAVEVSPSLFTWTESSFPVLYKREFLVVHDKNFYALGTISPKSQNGTVYKILRTLKIPYKPSLSNGLIPK